MRAPAAFLVLATLPSAALAVPCSQWQAPEIVGSIDTALLPEASGIVPSRAFPGRLYFNNDSGDGPYFYLTRADGSEIRRIEVSGFDPRDVEDIALGPCTGAAACIYLGDIGDNAERLAAVNFIEVAETADFKDRVDPVRIVNARYPDGPHNAEGFAIHPNGNLYLVTKDSSRKGAPAQVFMLTAAQLAASDEVQTFTSLGTLDLARYLDGAFDQRIVTSMDISPDGSRTLLLTYSSVFEWNQDLALPFDPARQLEAGRDYARMALPSLPQAEAVAYLPDADGILFTSEGRPNLSEVPVYRQRCAQR